MTGDIGEAVREKISQGRPTVFTRLEVWVWGLSQRFVVVRGKRPEERMERRARVVSWGVEVRPLEGPWILSVSLSAFWEGDGTIAFSSAETSR